MRNLILAIAGIAALSIATAASADVYMQPRGQMAQQSARILPACRHGQICNGRCISRAAVCHHPVRRQG